MRRSVARRFRLDVLLRMQRHSHRLPGGVRGWLRRFAADRPAVHDGAVLPGWAEPRITARASGPAPTPIDGSTDRAPAPTPLVVNGATDRLRCLLMCAPLDVGGLDEVVGFLARCLPGLGRKCGDDPVRVGSQVAV